MTMFKRIITYLCHQVCAFTMRSSYHEFIGKMNEIQEVQLNILKGIMSFNKVDSSEYEDILKYHRTLPITGYKELAEKGKSICVGFERFQPTSGSINKRKLIPYNSKILQEFDAAIYPWMFDMYLRFPKIKKGTHYWSLSWIPHKYRDEFECHDELYYLDPVKRFFLSKTMAVPSLLARVDSMDDHKFATAAILACDETLAFVSVWSPTFWLSIMHEILTYKDEIVRTVERGGWGDTRSSLKSFKSCRAGRLQLEKIKSLKKLDDIQKLWPRLELISCWNTSASKTFAKDLQQYFPKTKLQGKGVFATEAVITIPFFERYLLSYQSHFYEFECQTSKKILYSWELQPEMVVKPIITCGNGFYRYKIEDLLFVNDVSTSCPSLSFLGRAKTVDLVGEKVSYQTATAIVDQINLQFENVEAVCLIADSTGIPGYKCLLIESENTSHEAYQTIADFVEQKLQEYFHYRLARELGQLSAVSVVLDDEALTQYNKILGSNFKVEGDVKIEPILLKVEP